MESDSPTASLMETTGLEPLFDFVDGLARRANRRELGDVMDGLDVSLEALAEVSLEALAECVQFNERQYARHLIRSNEQSHVLLICWRSGQRTPIHNHPRAVGSMRVLRGIATESHFDFTPSELLKPTGSCDLNPGEVTTLQDPYIHQISNLQEPGLDLITLHVYSPPLPKMDTDRHIGEFRPTDFEHTLGSGI